MWSSRPSRPALHQPLYWAGAVSHQWNTNDLLLLACNDVLRYTMYGPTTQNIHGLLTKLIRSRWLVIGQVLFFACLWTEKESRSTNPQKRTRPISSHLDRKSLVNKIFTIQKKEHYFLTENSGLSRAEKNSAILPARVANHSAGFSLSCPLTKLAI